MTRCVLVIIGLLIVSLLSTACAESSAAFEFDVFEGGENIQHFALTKEPAHQLSYQVSLTYPDKRVLEFYRTKLPSLGWSECDLKDEWVQYLKKDNSSSIGVRQIMSYSVRRRENQLLMISLQYFSETVKHPNEKTAWNDNTQYVTVIVYNVSDLNKVLSLLPLSCPN